MRMPRKFEKLGEYPYFYLDKESFYIEATNFMMTGQNIDIIYSFLTSDLGFFTFSKFYTGPQFDATGFRYKKAYLDETFVPKPDDKEIETLRNILKRIKNQKDKNREMDSAWYDIIDLSAEEIQYVSLYKNNLLSQTFDKNNLIV